MFVQQVGRVYQPLATHPGMRSVGELENPVAVCSAMLMPMRKES